MKFFSHAQNFEDVLLWRALGHIDRGFYIDLGAAHPDQESVTRAFYERGWHGINVEPVGDQFRRLERSRPRDINLCFAVGEAPGTAAFFVVNGTGLSTLDPELAGSHQARGFLQERIEVPVDTLAAICQRHVRSDIHFLKVDVEGAERAALAGADFAAFRPWVILVEATRPMETVESHADWEPILTAAGYHFVWFDGLNRFYIAREHHAALARHFQAPPNVFDNFVRAADSEWVPRVEEATARHEALFREWEDLRARLVSARAEVDRLGRDTARIDILEAALRKLEQETGQTEALRRHIDHLNGFLDGVMARGEIAADWVRSMRASTSWRATTPLRGAMHLIGQARGRTASALPDMTDWFTRDGIPLLPAVEDAPGTIPPAPVPENPAPWEPPPPAWPVAVLRRSIHQFHSGSAEGDAITNAMLLCRDLLRRQGYHSEIFVEWIDPSLKEELRPMAELPRHAGYVLIVRHSFGHGAFARLCALPAPKVLIYHNITPPELLPEHLRAHALLGREQLAAWRGHVVAALADSEFNAIELRALGFEEARACTLLFDLEAMRSRATAIPARRAGEDKAPFTILFVGRVTPSKGQDQLIEAFAAFHAQTALPSRLVLVGRWSEADEPWVLSLRARIAAAGLEAHVLLTGLISDAARDDWYAHADLYVSLSHHEGFGVPLVEAMARGLPVLAAADGAVPYTLGDVPGALLTDRVPAAVATVLRGMAENPAARAALAGRQRHVLDRFSLDRQLPKLSHALALAGAAPPADPASRLALAANMRFTVTGHVNGSYSLAVVNRTLARALEAAWPGRTRIVPVETTPTGDLSGVLEAERPLMSLLAARPPPTTGPRVVISQHYPVFTGSPPADLMLALFFWEESLIPGPTVATLNNTFRGVLAPSRFVARALIDSGVSLPVHVVGYAPVLADFRASGALRRDVRDLSSGAPFTFLHVSSCFPRKGVDVLLAAYAKAFRRGERVRLVIKGFPNPHNDVAEQIATLRRTDPDLAEIVFINQDLSRAGMVALYQDADAMVLPTRGEGFNLPAAEAMAAGVPLLVTGGGGHSDFCDADTAELIDYRLTPARTHLSAPFSLWMEPDVDDLARKMHAMAREKDQDERVQDGETVAGRVERAHRAADVLSDQAAWAERIAVASLDILLAPPRAPVRIAWVSTWDVRCGVAGYSQDLIEAMPASPAVAGITVLCDDRTGARPPSARPSSARSSGVDFQVRPAWRVGMPESMHGLAEAIAREDPDAVVIQHQPGLIAWEALAALLTMSAVARRHVVVTLHSTPHLLDTAPEVRQAAIRALRGVDRVFAHTLADLDVLKGQGLSDNVTLMPHGARAAGRVQAARALTPASAPLIGCYGFFLRGKGIPLLIAALPLIRARFPRARLRLVNADYGSPDSAAEIATCRRAAAVAGLEDAIEFHTDFLTNDASLALLAECDVVALPYQATRESSSAALRTALGAGVAVAVTPLPLFDEAEDAVARLPGLDSEALAKGLVDLLMDAPERREIQAAARNWLAERDHAGIAERLRNLLLGLTASPPPPPLWRAREYRADKGGDMPEQERTRTSCND